MMFSNQLIKYAILFILLPILLQILGFIDVSFLSMFSFTFFFIGLTIYYHSYGANNALPVFLGAGIFLTGVFAFLIQSFLIDLTYTFIITGVFYITGFSLLLVFMGEVKRKKVLYAAGVFIFIATFLSLAAGNLQLNSFLLSLREVIKEYWLLLLMAVVTILLLYFEQRHSK